mmetsp:Transcript_13967/g.22118  ORF Transcript_13967/g.22118 Transcript_13967/m.22118 type:complete len:507 (-) Transcript_13967:831-2351(-)
MSGPKLSVVVAIAAKSRAIGRNGELPWKLKGEMKYFKALTMATNDPDAVNAVVMGRKTYASIPMRFRPLQGRLNVVLSRNENESEVREELALPESVILASSFDDALKKVSREGRRVENVFVIGGSSLFQEALRRRECEDVFLTNVHGEFEDCDTFFPEIDENEFSCEGCPVLAPQGMQEEGNIQYEYFQYRRKRCSSPDPTASNSPQRPVASSSLSQRRHEEYQYLDMVAHVLQNGVEKGDRTGTGTISTFGTSMRFSLRNNTMPLLTTKRTFWRGVAEELLWFISGDTNAKSLQEKDIHIWDGNGSREFLDKLGLTEREEGDLGPVYGFQWRHFGADYTTMHDDYTGKGVDQLAQLIHTIKTNPNDRRMILSAWNPAAFHLMALPPCHMFAQFYVANGELSCQMYQRSADMGLGVPFNIASYALLTHLIAKCTGLKAGEFIHIIGDCHVYKDHVEPLKEQLKREPTPFPTIKINSENTDIDGFKYSDFELVGYKPHKPIKMKMSV